VCFLLASAPQVCHGARSREARHLPVIKSRGRPSLSVFVSAFDSVPVDSIQLAPIKCAGFPRAIVSSRRPLYDAAPVIDLSAGE